MEKKEKNKKELKQLDKELKDLVKKSKAGKLPPSPEPRRDMNEGMSLLYADGGLCILVDKKGTAYYVWQYLNAFSLQKFQITKEF